MLEVARHTVKRLQSAKEKGFQEVALLKVPPFTYLLPPNIA